MIYKDKNGNLHDDMNGEARHLFPVNLEPYIAIDEVEAAQIRAQKITTPTVVTMRQARLALLNAGKLQLVNNTIAAMTGPAGDAARIEWDYSNEVKRNQPLTISLAQAIGMTDAEMDQLFIVAATL